MTLQIETAFCLPSSQTSGFILYFKIKVPVQINENESTPSTRSTTTRRPDVPLFIVRTFTGCVAAPQTAALVRLHFSATSKVAVVIPQAVLDQHGVCQLSTGRQPRLRSAARRGRKQHIDGPPFPSASVYFTLETSVFGSETNTQNCWFY